jgi:glycosyltransferase involved in cell wall biosynthesis
VKHLKILYISQYYFPYEKGGAEVSLRTLAENMASRHNVAVFTIDPSKNSEDLANGVLVIRRYIPQFSDFLFEGIEKKGKKNSLKVRFSTIYASSHRDLMVMLKEVVDKLNPGIIHLNNVVGFPLGKIYDLARYKGIKVVQSIRDNFLLGITSTGKKIPFWYSYINSVISKADVVHFPSNTVMEKFGSQIKTEKVHIPNTTGVDFEEKKWRDLIDIKNNDQVKKIAYVGVLERHKGVHLLSEWFEDIYEVLNANVELTFVGDGTLKDYLERQLRRFIEDGIVKITGWLPKNEVDSIMQKSHFLILPSQWEEMFGRVLIEGFYNGCLPVGSTWGAIPEVIGDHSLIFKDKDEFIEIFREFSESDKWHKKMSDLKEHMLQFSLSNHSRKFEQLYKNLFTQK